MNYTETDLTEFFTYLDELRANGKTYMFGASGYLQTEFTMNKHDARDVTLSWMRTFNHETPADVRARAALVKTTEATWAPRNHTQGNDDDQASR